MFLIVAGNQDKSFCCNGIFYTLQNCFIYCYCITIQHYNLAGVFHECFSLEELVMIDYSKAAHAGSYIKPKEIATIKKSCNQATWVAYSLRFPPKFLIKATPIWFHVSHNLPGCKHWTHGFIRYFVHYFLHVRSCDQVLNP